MNIIITGGNGFIARNLASQLNKNNKIILLCKGNHKKLEKKYKIKKFELEKNIIPKLNCDVLIHTAGITPQKKYSSKEYMKINYLGFKSILKNINIKKKIIYLSTTDIYKDKSKNISTKENRKITIKNISPYAKSKYLSEIYLKNLNNKVFSFEKIILRLPGIIGNGNHLNFISKIINNVKKNKEIQYFGGKNMFNNVFHINDLSNLILHLIKIKMKKKYDIINIGTQNPIKIEEIFTLISKKYNFSVREIKSQKKDFFNLDISKLNILNNKNIDTKTVLKKYLN